MIVKALKKLGSKLVRGIKKVGSKIVKGIKTGFKGVMKFVGELGIVGQIGLSLLLPGMGQMIGGWAQGMMASSNVFIKGAGHILNTAIKIGDKIGGVAKTITGGVTKILGHTAGTILNKMELANPFKNFTAGLGFGPIDPLTGKAAGIDISNYQFMADPSGKATTLFGDNGVFNEVGSNIGKSFRDLVSKSTFDGSLNSFAKQAMLDEQIGPRLQQEIETFIDNPPQVEFDADGKLISLEEQYKDFADMGEFNLDTLESTFKPEANFNLPTDPSVSKLPDTLFDDPLYKGKEYTSLTDIVSDKTDSLLDMQKTVDSFNIDPSFSPLYDEKGFARDILEMEAPGGLPSTPPIESILAPTNKSANILTETGNPTNPYEFITPEVADYRRGLAQQTHDQNLAYKAGSKLARAGGIDALAGERGGQQNIAGGPTYNIGSAFSAADLLAGVEGPVSANMLQFFGPMEIGNFGRNPYAGVQDIVGQLQGSYNRQLSALYG